jgi:AAA+ superfamily predicted ATPase
LHCIERIGTMASATKGDPGKIDPQDPDIAAIREFLDLTPMEAEIFSVIFILNFKNRNVDIGDLAGYLETSNISVLPLMAEIESLEQKKLICKHASGNRLSAQRRMGVYEIGYYVTRNILEAIMKKDKSLLGRKDKLTMVSFLEEVGKMVEDRDDGNISYDDLVNETQDMLRINEELDFLRKIKEYRLYTENLLMLLFVCRETINGVDGCDLVRTCEKIYEDVDTRFRMRQSLVTGSNELMTNGLLKLREGYFRTDREVLLTDKAGEALFGADKEMIMARDNKKKEVILWENLKPERLFFHAEEQKQLEFLTRLLQQKNYLAMINRMESMHLRAGITVLFHGAPGTGKTASAFEIARKTGRDIFMVDISSTKSMWFGESEKIIKELFDRYRRMVENGEKTPILLFNEADAVFSTRKDVSRSAVAQTENAIQNIILQEMESLKGILIATTNLTQNLDQAFERRFLFKIAFSTPDQHTTRRILRDKLPGLKPSEAEKLAGQFDISGGNIENIARKAEMYRVLHGKFPETDQITAFFREELSNKRAGSRKIGF